MPSTIIGKKTDKIITGDMNLVWRIYCSKQKKSRIPIYVLFHQNTHRTPRSASFGKFPVLCGACTPSSHLSDLGSSFCVLRQLILSSIKCPDVSLTTQCRPQPFIRRWVEFLPLIVKTSLCNRRKPLQKTTRNQIHSCVAQSQLLYLPAKHSPI